MKNRISVREQMSASKKEKAQAGNEWSNSLLKSSQTRKKPPPLSLCVFVDQVTESIKTGSWANQYESITSRDNGRGFHGHSRSGVRRLLLFGVSFSIAM